MARKEKEKELRPSFRSNTQAKNNPTEIKRSGGKESKGIPLKGKIKIYCNSLQTEPNYFQEIKELLQKEGIKNISIEIYKVANKGGGESPLDCVKRASNDEEACREKWVVFDKDEFEIEKAISSAKKDGIEVAWSNESFELWFLMHFHSITTSLDRQTCKKKLRDELKKRKGIEYAKNHKKIFSLFSEKERKTAISNAKKRHQSVKRDKLSPTDSNPCTTVYRLVEKLLT